jgi:hypothetical protein
MLRRRTRSRARLALAGCVLWLLGVEAMPALHEALHDRLAPHRHDHGSIVAVSFGDTTHRHPDGTIHYAAPTARTTRPAGSRSQRPHGSGFCTRDVGSHADGLAHHAAALAPAPPPITQPLPVDRRPVLVVDVRTIDLVARDPLAATARGPPAVA